MMPSPTMIDVLQEESELASGNQLWLGGGHTALPFYYLAGPMSNLPGFNFAEFHRIAGKLREEDYNIVNPAQLDHEIERMVRENSEGSHRQLTEEMAKRGLKNPSWAECLVRDIGIVTTPTCQGVIVIDGWENSQGAQFETYVAYKLRKPIYKYNEGLQGWWLDGPIDRRAALTAAGVED